MGSGRQDKVALNNSCIKKGCKNNYIEVNAHTNDLFKNLRLLKLDDANIYSSKIFVYKSIHNYNNAELFD